MIYRNEELTGGNFAPGSLLLTEKNLIFKGRRGPDPHVDITIPLENVSPTLRESKMWFTFGLSSTPSLGFIVESVNGDVLAHFESRNKYDEWKMAIEKQIPRRKKQQQQQQIDRAKERERALDYDSAIRIWEKMGKPKEAARVRKLKAEQGSVKVDQTVVHGDYVDDRDTIVKDSVVSKSSIGGGSSKMQELEKLKEMFDSGFISKKEMEKMKKEILGK